MHDAHHHWHRSHPDSPLLPLQSPSSTLAILQSTPYVVSTSAMAEPAAKEALLTMICDVEEQRGIQLPHGGHAHDTWYARGIA